MFENANIVTFNKVITVETSAAKKFFDILLAVIFIFITFIIMMVMIPAIMLSYYNHTEIPVSVFILVAAASLLVTLFSVLYIVFFVQNNKLSIDLKEQTIDIELKTIIKQESFSYTPEQIEKVTCKEKQNGFGRNFTTMYHVYITGPDGTLQLFQFQYRKNAEKIIRHFEQLNVKTEYKRKNFFFFFGN